jgi:hypothetical protein
MGQAARERVQLQQEVDRLSREVDRLNERVDALEAADQAWFWTAEWQEGEREADEDIAAGRGTFHDSDEDFLASLEP